MLETSGRGKYKAASMASKTDLRVNAALAAVRSNMAGQRVGQASQLRAPGEPWLKGHRQTWNECMASWSRSDQEQEGSNLVRQRAHSASEHRD